MSIYVGSDEITEIKSGSATVDSVWVGPDRAWTSTFYKTITNDYDFQRTVIPNAGNFDEIYAGWGILSQLNQSSIAPNTRFDLNVDQFGNYFTETLTNLYVYLEYHSWDSSQDYSILSLSLDDTTSNSGWTSMTIGSDVYLRSAASYYNIFGSTTWSWTSSTPYNPFGTTVGAEIKVVFE